MHLSFSASLAHFHCRGSLLQLYRHTKLSLSHRRWHTAKITTYTHVSVRGTVAKAVDHSSFDQQPQTLTAWHHKPKVSHLCPACGQQIQRLPVLERHFQKCCPDLISWQVKVDTAQDTALQPSCSTIAKGLCVICITRLGMLPTTIKVL